MTSLVQSNPLGRPSDDELPLCDRFLTDVAYAQQRSRPMLPSVFGRKLRHRKQWFVILDRDTKLPSEFRQYHDFKISTVRLPATVESQGRILSAFAKLENAGHHFGGLEPRGCEMQDDVLIFYVDVRDDEPEL